MFAIRSTAGPLTCLDVPSCRVRMFLCVPSVISTSPIYAMPEKASAALGPLVQRAGNATSLAGRTAIVSYGIIHIVRPVSLTSLARAEAFIGGSRDQLEKSSQEHIKISRRA